MDRIVNQTASYRLAKFNLESELEKVVLSKAKDIFGANAIFFNTKKLLSSPDKAIQTIPDGYLIDFSKPHAPQLKLIECELGHHDAYKHIMVQLGKFSSLSIEAKLSIKNLLIDNIRKQSVTYNKFKKLLLSTPFIHESDFFDHLLLKNTEVLPTVVIIDSVSTKLRQALTQLANKPEILLIKKYSDKNNSYLLNVEKIALTEVTGANKNPNTNENHYFDYHIRKVKNNLIALGEHTYRYIYECEYLPQSNFGAPAKFEISSIDPESKIKPIKLIGYKQKPYKNNTDGYLTKLEIETDFQAPYTPNKPYKTYVEVECYAPNLPPHLSYTPGFPVHGSASLTIDLKKSHFNYERVKLFEYLYRNASSRPLIKSDLAPTKEFNKKGIVQWKLVNPQWGHHYFLQWAEPCVCTWCRHKITT